MDRLERALSDVVDAGIRNGLEDYLVSDSEKDGNGVEANVVDGLFAIARGLHDVADAVRGPVRSSEEE